MSDGPYVWPARNVAEHAYCPRLFYYMQVEGVFLPSADTEQGQAAHRRVNRPGAVPPEPADPQKAGIGGTGLRSAPGSRSPDPEHDAQRDSVGDLPTESSEPDRPRAVRSLVLTSERLELTATLDLAEFTSPTTLLEPTVAVPVEYRKGRPRHLQLATGEDESDEREPGQPSLTRVEPWPTDRVQIGLQVLLLEEHGYHVPHAVLYYAAERRRLTVTVDDDLRRAALAELQAARLTAAGSRPLPLVNDARCPRCSLQPICLPDEVHHQRATATADSSAADPPAPRRMWPPRDDGLHLVAQTEGVRVGVRGASLRFVDRHGVCVREMPTATIESLTVVGAVQVSTQALHLLADNGVPVVFMTSAGRAVAWLEPPGPTSARVRTAQVERFTRTGDRLDVARAIVAAKISNQRTLLMRNAPDLPPATLAELSERARTAAAAPSVETLLGHEGQASAVYFASFSSMLRNAELGRLFTESGRKRRPPPDPVNALLSFAYSILVNESVSALRSALLEPSIGAYHTPRPGRPALALDFMEPFRPLIADSVAVSLINRGEVGPGHFLQTAAGCALTDYGRRAFFDAWGRRMATEVTHPVFEYRLSYRRMLMLHARLIAAWLLGEAPTLAFLTTR